ncbi:heme-degrading monooxygenase HmoA [Chitinivorax tropicus]|uniref:Heme-degrading monooxygenase HmoA n=1 Tax=Chitinivorax tropicus TaxID=714531 RepID=A0A840MJC0_9PROT|nr:heme-degrading monooxygenase HmoA [Chitinivorax tropicus]
MFSRVMHIQSKPGRLAEITSLFQDSVLPALRRQEGFVSTLLLTDPATGKGMSITIWQSEEALKASSSSGFLMEQIRKVAPLLETPPVAEQLVAHL